MGAPVRLECSVPRHSGSSLFCLAPDRARELKEPWLINSYGNTKLTQGPCLCWCVWEDVSSPRGQHPGSWSPPWSPLWCQGRHRQVTKQLRANPHSPAALETIQYTQARCAGTLNCTWPFQTRSCSVPVKLVPFSYSWVIVFQVFPNKETLTNL